MRRLAVSGRSDVGLARRHNEDCYDVDTTHNLFLVADGMGGHSHGEVASSTAVREIRDYIGSYAPLDGGLSAADLLETAFREAHDRVLRKIREDRSLEGMGTTVVALLVRGDAAAVAHVGDSRLYRLREGELSLLTEDHTWVHEQMTAGFLSAAQARVHPLKNVVTRALGGEGRLQVDIQEVDVAPGDRFLLCSDGLTTVLLDEEIGRCLRHAPSPEDACHHLVRTTQRRSGPDDVTVVVLDVGPAS